MITVSIGYYCYYFIVKHNNYGPKWTGFSTHSLENFFVNVGINLGMALPNDLGSNQEMGPFSRSHLILFTLIRNLGKIINGSWSTTFFRGPSLPCIGEGVSSQKVCDFYQCIGKGLATPHGTTRKYIFDNEKVATKFSH